jgi:hypothetical protein
MGIVNYQKPVRSLSIYVLGMLVIGAIFAFMGMTSKDGPGRVMGWMVAAMFVGLAAYFAWAALSYATGRLDRNDIDPGYRHPRFWERWPIGKSR